MNPHTRSRRSFLTASSAVIAGLVPAAVAIAASPADAELLHLGGEFDRLHADYLPANKLAHLHGFEMSRLVKAAGRSISWQEYQALEAASGYTESGAKADAIGLQIDRITKLIRDLPATTPQGFYVKVRAASFDCGFSHRFDGQEPSEMDHEVECFFHLLEDARRFAEPSAT